MVDLKEIRLELATKVLAGMAGSGKISLKEVDKEAVKAAFGYADELLEQAYPKPKDEDDGTEVPNPS